MARGSDIITIRDKQWTLDDLCERAGVNKSSMSKRLSKFRRGLITEESVFAKPRWRPPAKIERMVSVGGAASTSISELSAQCGISIETARNRIRRYLAGEMDEESLYHIGPIMGRSPSKKNGVGNLEWRALKDKPRQVKGPGAGTWESRHIPPPVMRNIPASGARARMITTAPANEEERHMPYSGQYRIALGR